MLVSSKELLLAAQRGGYAVGAFNTNNLEITHAIFHAAQAQRPTRRQPVGVVSETYACSVRGFASFFSSGVIGGKNRGELYPDRGDGERRQ